MARAPSRALGGLPFRGGDRLTAGADAPRLRLLPLIATLAALAAAVAYLIPLATTGDPLWPLPSEIRVDALVVSWDGRSIELLPGDAGFADVGAALTAALGDIRGIEYAYGLGASDVAALRAGGRAVEARFSEPPRLHGPYAIGPFTRILVPLAGPEARLRLIFFGDADAYRAGPLRTGSLDRLERAADTVAGSR